MDSLFSHAVPPEEPASPTSAAGDSAELSHAVKVPVEPDQAFEGFIDYLHLWWPSEYTVFGSGTHVAIEDGELGEESVEGHWLPWAKVQKVVHGGLLEMESLDPSRARVSVRFTAEGPSATTVSVDQDAPLVILEQDQHPIVVSWLDVLGYYARFMGADTRSQDS
ncbi:hypothetical protein HD598_001041 [Neomicrococcus aestuarii]|uniref:Uncharacterized protein n=1 Tax=Neomicrococcus aestuarii TaxID=556325 RepID=A0A7W8TT45_9MICC|nr:hypothetical protein [Neomicrococcus aestuarii]MBB5512354.1 hypothetical protein [Neomicrococcus aestuarii]